MKNADWNANFPNRPLILCVSDIYDDAKTSCFYEIRSEYDQIKLFCVGFSTSWPAMILKKCVNFGASLSTGSNYVMWILENCSRNLVNCASSKLIKCMRELENCTCDLVNLARDLVNCACYQVHVQYMKL